jgi:hypothetical protein
MASVVIGRRYAGPPESGNGGYVAGLVARGIDGPATAVLRAIIPLDTPLDLSPSGSRWVLSGEGGGLIAEASPASAADLPEPPPPPTLEQARAAGLRYPGLEETFHPICFSCATARDEGDGLRVFTGQLEGAADGVLAGVWTPHAAFADPDGLVPSEIVWAALGCPGWYAWLVRDQHAAGLLGTMTGEVVRRPRAGASYIVMAWPIEGGTRRKRFAGVALFSADGECLARGRQVWISFPTPA